MPDNDSFRNPRRMDLLLLLGVVLFSCSPSLGLTARGVTRKGFVSRVLGGVSSAAALPLKPVVAAEPEEVVSDSGLRVFDLVEGTGDQPAPGQTVTVDYTGWMGGFDNADGKFDSSRGRKPLTFPVGIGRVIPGWDEGVLGMKVGGKRRMIIPPILGYGVKRGVAGVIPANATLYFEVELLKVTP